MNNLETALHHHAFKRNMPMSTPNILPLLVCLLLLLGAWLYQCFKNFRLPLNRGRVYTDAQVKTTC